jgi:hypothetical protein
MEQYTQENCDKAQKVFDSLIDNIVSAGQNADEKDKVGLFKSAILLLINLMKKLRD